MNFATLLSNIKNNKGIPGTAHSSSIANIDDYEELIEKQRTKENNCFIGVSHSSAVSNIDLFEQIIEEKAE